MYGFINMNKAKPAFAWAGGRMGGKAVLIILMSVLLICASVFSACDAAPETAPVPENTPAPENASAPGVASPGSADAGEVAADGNGGSADTEGDTLLSGINEGNFPAIDGSTANLPLIAALYAKACGVDSERAEKMVRTYGTSTAWTSLSSSGDDDGDDKGPDMIIAYEPEADLMKEAKAIGAGIDALGRDGLVFLTGADNPVNILTVEQIKDIYTGRVTNWSELGGNDEPIAAFQRNEGSGSQVLFEKLVLMGEKPADSAPKYVSETMGELIESLADFEGDGASIGYSVFYYADLMYEAPNLKMISVEGVEPSSKTIGDRSYPLTNDFYIALRPGLKDDSPAKRIREFLLSGAGTKFLEDNGYVPAR